MAQQFAKAVEILARADVGADVRTQAFTYLQQVKASADGWFSCVQRFGTRVAGDDGVRFQCLAVIEHAIKTRYGSLQPERINVLKATLSAWMESVLPRDGSEPNYIKNKVAQLSVLIFVNEFPEKWPTFFKDISRFLPTGGAAAMDFYLRVMDAVDEIVVYREMARSSTEAARNGVIKDAMRANDLPGMADIWVGCLRTYTASHPAISCLCLQVIGKYIAWVDISLVVNPQMIQCILGLLPANVTTRKDAANCISAIISKGMPGAAKCQLISQLGLVGKIREWMQYVQQHGNDEENEFSIAVADLYSKVQEELLDTISTSSKAAPIGPGVVQLLESSLPVMCALLGHEYDDVSETVMPCVQKYIRFLKGLKKGQITAAGKQGVEMLLAVIIRKMRYDVDYNHEAEGEDEDDFQEYRRSLKLVLQEIGFLDISIVVRVAHEYVRVNLARATLATKTYQDIELALYIAYEMGEIAGPQANFPAGQDPSASPLLPIMTAVVESQVTAVCLHPAVSLSFFEVCTRLGGFFVHRPDCLPFVIGAFLGPSGLQSANERVRARSTYLFMQLVKKKVRSLLHPHLEQIVKTLQPVMRVRGQKHLQMSEQRSVFEAISYILFTKSVPPATQRQYFEQITQMLIQENDHVIQAVAKTQDPRERAHFALLLQHIPHLMTSLSKGIRNPESLGSSGCGPALEAALKKFVQSLQIPFERVVIRRGVRSFLHTLIVCMGKSILPVVPQILAVMGGGAGLEDIRDTVALVNQIVARFKAEFAPHLNEILLPLVQAIFQMLGVNVDPLDADEREQHALMRRAYFDLLGAIVKNNCTDVFLSPKNAPHLQNILKTLVQGANEAGQPRMQTTCLALLRKLIEVWFGKAKLPGFETFVSQDVVTACFKVLSQPGFEVNDGEHFLLMKELAHLLKHVHIAGGLEFITFLKSTFLPSLGVPTDVSVACVAALEASGPANRKPLELFLKQFVAWAQTARGQ